MIPQEERPLLREIVEHIAQLEETLSFLKTLPRIVTNPKNPAQQRTTPAAKLYKEYLQQYINAIKAVEYVIYHDKKMTKEEAEESPLRKWFKGNV